MVNTSALLLDEASVPLVVISLLLTWVFLVIIFLWPFPMAGNTPKEDVKPVAEAALI